MNLPQVGATGSVLEPLCPAGSVVVDGVTYPAQTQGEQIDTGLNVVIVGHAKDQLLVSKATWAETRFSTDAIGRMYVAGLAILLAVIALTFGIVAFAQGEINLSTRGRGIRLQGGAAIAFGMTSVSFALLLFLAAWVAWTGRGSWRQFSGWEKVLGLIVVLGVVAGIVGMVLLYWDSFIWGFMAVLGIIFAVVLYREVKKDHQPRN